MDTEKDKRKAPPSRWNWIYGRGLAYLVGVLVLLIGMMYLFFDQHFQLRYTNILGIQAVLKPTSVDVALALLGVPGGALNVLDTLVLPAQINSGIYFAPQLQNMRSVSAGL